MADLFADQYIPPSYNYRNGGDDFAAMPRTGGEDDVIVEGQAGAPLISASVETNPRRWWAWFRGMNAMLTLAFAMGLVALIIAVLVWYGCANLKKKVNCLACKSFPKLRDDVNNFINQRVCGTLGLAYLAPGWGYVGTTGTLAATGMLIGAGTQPPATITVNALPSAASVVQAVYPGRLKSLAVEINALITAGSATYTVTINGVATALTGSILSTGTVTAYTFDIDADALPITFNAGDTIGVTIAQTGVATTTPTFTSAAQVLVQYTPVAVPASSSSSSS